MPALSTKSFSFTQGPVRPALITIGVLCAAFVLAACGGDGGGGESEGGGEAPADVADPQRLLEWMAAHPENAGLVVVSQDRGADVEFGGDRRFPLASTRKVLIVGALAERAEGFETRIPRAAVERFYAAGTDAGAHSEAGLDRPSLSLGEIAQAAIEASDNAAADALLERVGPAAVDAYAKRQGMTAEDPIYPLLGEYAAWGADSKWAERSPAERATKARDLAGEVLAKEVKIVGVEDQRRLAAESVAGTPAEWAALMASIGTGGDRRLVELLDWPRRKSPTLRKRFERYLAKGGSLPGIVTEASYAKPRGGAPVAAALFLRDLPTGVEADLRESFAHQKLIMRLASDGGFRKTAAALLKGR